MVDFNSKLPSMNIEGRHNGTYNNWEAGFPGVFTTRDTKLGEFLHGLRNCVSDDRRLVFIDGKILVCSPNWIRDHVHQMKAFKHWEYNLGSFLNFIIDTQREDGQFYELIKQYDDYHWKLVNEDCYVMYPDDNLSLVRLELEADVEYLVVEGAMNYYKVYGDDKWLKSVLPKLEKSIEYITSSPKRWDEERGLVKRPFTVDTWDFTPEKNSMDGKKRAIHPDSQMSIMHGDNSGVYQAMKQLAWFNRRLGNEYKAKEWDERAEILRDNMFKYLWNGKFFIHQLHINHNGIDNKESERLSLSNPYDMNRGVTDYPQSVSIIEEYIARRKTTSCFAEWFSIDPPYEEGFGDHAAGTYVNGAISPFTAGELSKAAFENGYEEYAWDIIERFMELHKRDNAIYFLYSPVDTKPQGGGPSAWGAASFLNAIDEGLAGVVDIDTGYKKINFSPRFVVTNYDELRYTTGYEVTNTMVDIKFVINDVGMRYVLTSPANEVNAHIMLPNKKACSKLLVNGKDAKFEIIKVGKSQYVQVNGIKEFIESKVDFEILF